MTSASSAPVRAMRCASAARNLAPRWPVAWSISSRDAPWAADAAARMAGSGHGARPRLVCRMTPVALTTGTRSGAADASSRDTSVSASAPTDVASSPALRRSRSSATTSRAAATTAAWSRSPSRDPAAARTRSMLGGCGDVSAAMRGRYTELSVGSFPPEGSREEPESRCAARSLRPGRAPQARRRPRS